MILSASTALTLITVRQIKNHTGAVGQSILMLESIEIMLEYRSLSVEEIFRSLSVTERFDLLLFIKEINRRLSAGEEYELLYKEVLNDIQMTANYDGEDRGYMSGFLSLLGKSDVYGQIANCKMYKELFKTKLKALQKNENEKCKTYAALILGVGIMISLILL